MHLAAANPVPQADAVLANKAQRDPLDLQEMKERMEKMETKEMTVLMVLKAI